MIEPSAICISLKMSSRLFLFSRETKSEQAGLAWDARFETEAEESDSIATTTSARNKKKSGCSARTEEDRDRQLENAAFATG